jgi:lipid-A-disaccharide synthase
MSRVMVVAGEVSGDIHAGNMLTELKRIRPDVDAFGVGGERLEAAGLRCLAATDELSHMGLVEVLRELPRIRGIMRMLETAVRNRRPAVAVLVDSPDFNLRLAARLDRLGIPVVLYVSPQLWAWRRGRVRTVRRLAREVLCILPFEVPFYRDHGVPARYVGHPLVDDVVMAGPVRPSQRSGRRLALLPGSRSMEIRQLLPTMLATLANLGGDEIDDAVLIEAPGTSSVVDRVLAEGPSGQGLRRVTGDARRLALAASSMAWTASGTATLECALMDVPMVVGYRLQAVSALLARLLVRVPHVALANLIAGERAAPELLQNDWSVERLTATTRELLAEGGVIQRQALAKVRDRLGGPGASRRAAEAVAEYLR